MAKVVSSREKATRRETCDGAEAWKTPKQNTIGLRVALSSILVIVLLIGVNLYAAFQLREVTTLSIELVSQRYPAIESAKWLLTNLYAQLASERRYLAARDPWFLMQFRDEAEEFTQTLTVLQSQESSLEGRALLGVAEQLYADYRLLFRTHVNQRSSRSPNGAADYEKKRNAVITQIAQRLQAYVGSHETKVSDGVKDVRLRSVQAHTFTQLMIATMLLILVMLGIAGFSILRLLRRRQESADQTGFVEVGRIASDEPCSSSPHGENNTAIVFTPRLWRQAR